MYEHIRYRKNRTKLRGKVLELRGLGKASCRRLDFSWNLKEAREGSAEEGEHSRHRGQPNKMHKSDRGNVLFTEQQEVQCRWIEKYVGRCKKSGNGVVDYDRL